MTTLRPEHDGELGASYEPHGVHEDGEDAFEAVVGGLADPLTDPIPGTTRHAPPAGGRAPLPTAQPGPAAGTAARQRAGTGGTGEPAAAEPGDRTGEGGTGRRARPAAAGPPAAPQDPARAAAPYPGPTRATGPAAFTPAPEPAGGSAPIPSGAAAERPAGKHARQPAAPAPVPASAPVPPAPVAQQNGAGPGEPPARHAVRPEAPVPGPDAEATAFLPKTPPGPRASPAPSASAPDAEATAFLPRTPPAPAAPAPASTDAEATAFIPKTAPAPGGPAPFSPDAGQRLIPPLGAPAGGPQPQQGTQPQARPPTGPAAPVPADSGALDQETVALRSADVRRAVASDDAAAPAGGRAERRKAAKAGARGRNKRPQPAPAAAQRPPGRPLTRIEARQAARALKDSPGVVVSRAVGELFISFGVLMLLFVTYQLWWTNVRADNFANDEASKIQSTWKSHKGPTVAAFEPGQGFAIIHIPKLDVVAPIAQGVSKEKVLDHGEVGHYSDGPLKTAMPEDKTGNFALAAHRNTHGEPFRYINQLVPGDKVVVETQDEYFTYEMTRTLPQTSPANVGVISPIPQGSGFSKPGRYITLTTCTPEFTSTYRLIVWGKMVSEQPRSQGLPAALQQ